MSISTSAMDPNPYPGEIGTVGEVSYAWVHQGDKVWCAWCGVDRQVIGDQEQHIKNHQILLDCLEDLLPMILATNPGLNGSVEDAGERLREIA
jgi:hypothetical protein